MCYFGLFLDGFLWVWSSLYHLAEGFRIIVNSKCFYLSIRVGRGFSKVCYLILLLGCVSLKDCQYLVLLTGECTSTFPSLSRNGTKMFSFLYPTGSRVLVIVIVYFDPFPKLLDLVVISLGSKFFRINLKNLLLGVDSEMNVFSFVFPTK